MSQEAFPRSDIRSAGRAAGSKVRLLEPAGFDQEFDEGQIGTLAARQDELVFVPDEDPEAFAPILSGTTVEVIGRVPPRAVSPGEGRRGPIAFVEDIETAARRLGVSAAEAARVLGRAVPPAARRAGRVTTRVTGRVAFGETVLAFQVPIGTPVRIESPDVGREAVGQEGILTTPENAEQAGAVTLTSVETGEEVEFPGAPLVVITRQGVAIPIFRNTRVRVLAPERAEAVARAVSEAVGRSIAGVGRGVERATAGLFAGLERGAIRRAEEREKREERELRRLAIERGAAPTIPTTSPVQLFFGEVPIQRPPGVQPAPETFRPGVRPRPLIDIEELTTNGEVRTGLRGAFDINLGF